MHIEHIEKEQQRTASKGIHTKRCSRPAMHLLYPVIKKEGTELGYYGT